ncbi:MAG: hydroxysqualene dehydroxylase HpnE [Planctomycetota bacterium]|nr:hydroxysqualene dehydroxylase HpnE [Planctomycetota bacterium]
MSRPRRVVVLGGGVAGLSAAFGLADRGHRVSLLESRPRCGGRAFATHDQVLGRPIDNGFHVMLGCYRATRALCRRLGTEDGFEQGDRLQMRYRFADGRGTSLTLSRLPVPLAMPWGVLRLGVGFGARLRALLGMGSVLLGARASWTVADWLRRRWQQGAPDQVLWRPLCRAVMNCEPEEASASQFLATLREAFFGRAAGAALWIPKRTWAELLGDPAPAALEAAGVSLRTRARVRELEVRGGRVACVVLGDGERVEVGDDTLVVSAMPWFALARALGGDAPAAGGALRSAPIVTAYFDVVDGVAPPDEGPVVALVGAAPFHFLLRTPGDDPRRFALLSGGDRAFDGMSVDEIAAIARAEVGRYFSGVDLERATVRVRKEQHATFVPSPESAASRPRPGRLVGGPENLLVCGDWTATGFPSTLEGAARSAETLVATLGSR